MSNYDDDYELQTSISLDIEDLIGVVKTFGLYGPPYKIITIYKEEHKADILLLHKDQLIEISLDCILDDPVQY